MAVILGLLVLFVVVRSISSVSGGASGARASSKTSKTLDVDVAVSRTALEITNVGSGEVAGRKLVVYIDGQPPFTYKTVFTLPRLRDSVRIPLSTFTQKDGTRFNPSGTAVTVIWVGGGGYDYVSFKN